MSMKKLKYCIISLIVIIAVSLTLLFADFLEIALKLKPDLRCVSSDAFEVHFIDVGQGDAIAIRFKNEKTMLIDSGPAGSKKKLFEYLDNVFFDDNYDTFDYVLLTHSDADHCGNMAEVVNRYKINNFYRPMIYTSSENVKNVKIINDSHYKNLINALKDNDVTTFFVEDGQEIIVGEDKINIYETNTLTSTSDTNSFSPMVILSSNGFVTCLAGDMGVSEESNVMNRHTMPDVDLYKLSHHGSYGSNSYEVLEALQPEYIVCSVGTNSYGHPASETLSRMSTYDETYDKTTYSTFKTTLDYGNIIYYKNNDGAISVVNIENVGEYIFIDWWIIVVLIDAFVVIQAVSVVVYNKPIKKIKKVKNMKA